jgi:hypothetical protein
MTFNWLLVRAADELERPPAGALLIREAGKQSLKSHAC